MAKIKYNSEIGLSIISNLKEASQIINNDISSKISSDFSDLTRVGLFSSQINNIMSAARDLAASYESFATIISGASDDWKAVVQETTKINEEFAEQVETNQNESSRKPSSGGTRLPSYKPSSGNNNNNNSNSNNNNDNKDSNVQEVEKGKEIKQGDIEDFVVKLDDSTIPVLIQKINKLMDDNFSSKILFDVDDSKIITIMLKKILGDTSDDSIPADMSPEEIQKILLEKINSSGIDLTTPEGRAQFEQYIKEQLNVEVDEDTWDKLLYGDNVEKVDLSDVEDVGGTWVVAKTQQDIKSYATYIDEESVRQNANTAKWGDKCLSFAEAHTYDLYNNTKTNGEDASRYVRNGYRDFMSDDKQVVLSKVYDEIKSGKPVVLQVNGNTSGTSRHFVTVVGFKEGVISGATLKESDLLIIDSWDGKIERMDTSKSRFMTSGAQCNNGYTGYRVRVLKTED